MSLAQQTSTTCSRIRSSETAILSKQQTTVKCPQMRPKPEAIALHRRAAQWAVVVAIRIARLNIQISQKIWMLAIIRHRQTRWANSLMCLIPVEIMGLQSRWAIRISRNSSASGLGYLQIIMVRSVASREMHQMQRCWIFEDRCTDLNSFLYAALHHFNLISKMNKTILLRGNTTNIFNSH